MWVRFLKGILILSVTGVAVYCGLWVSSEGVFDDPRDVRTLSPEELKSGGELGEAAAEGYFARDCFQKLVAAGKARSTFECHLEACHAIRDLDVSEYGILDRMLAKQWSGDWGLFRTILYLRWLEIDKSGMFAHLGTLIAEERDESVLGTALDYARFADETMGAALEARMAELRTLDQSGALAGALAEQRNALRQLVARRAWEGESPELFFQAIQNLSSQSVSAALEELALIDDPAIMARALESLTRSSDSFSLGALTQLDDMWDRGLIKGKEVYIGVVSRQLNVARGRERLEGMRWALGAMDSADFARLVANTRNFSGMKDVASEEILEVLMQAPYSEARDNAARNALLASQVTSWSDKLALVDKLMPDDAQAMSFLIQRAYQAGQLEEGLARLEGMRGTPGFEQMANGLAHAWGKEKPGEYVEWALVALEGRNLENGISSVANDWMQKDPEGVEAFTKSLPAGTLRDRFETTVGMNLAQRDALAGLAFALETESAAARHHVMTEALSRWSETEPRAAMTFLVEKDFLGEVSNRGIITSVARNWGNRDVAEAVEYFKSSADSRVREEGISVLASAYFAMDYEGGLSLLESMPAGDRRDNAINSVLNDRIRQGFGDNYGGENVEEALLRLVDSEAVRRRIRENLERGIRW